MSFTKTESKNNFETWLNKPFVSTELKASLSNASILILPSEGFRDHAGPVFPVQTGELFEFFKSNLPDDWIIDVCVNEEDFREIALHSDFKRIGNFIVKQAAMGVFIGVILLYIEYKAFKDEPAPATIENTVIGTNSTVSNSPNSTFVTNNTTIVNEIKEEPVVKAQPPVKKYHEPTKIKFSFTVVDSTGECKEFNYEGAAKDLKTAVEEIKNLYNDGNTEN